MEQLDDIDVKTLRRLVSVLNGGELTQKEFVAAFEEVVKIVLNIEKKLIADNANERSSMKTEFDGLKTSSGKNFEEEKKKANAFIEEKISGINKDAEARLARMEGRITDFGDNRETEEAVLYERLKELIPTIDDIIKFLPQSGESVRDSLEMLQGDERLDISAIKGMEKLQQDILAGQKSGKPVTFVGGARGIYVYVGGVKKGIMNTLNFVAGTGVSIAYSKVNGLDRITINATGSGVTVETPPETPDAVITVFTVTAEPQWIVADGTTYYAGKGYTYAALAVTMEVPPSSFIRAII